MKRTILVVLTVTALVLALLLSACTPKVEAPAAKYGQTKSLLIGGGAIGSQTYLLNSMIASYWTQDLGIPSSSLILGEIDGVKHISAGQCDFSYTSAPTVYLASHGAGDWTGKPVTNMRAVINLTQSMPIYFAVRGDSNISKMSDLVNKRMARGEAGTTADVYPKLIMEAGYGMTEDKIKAGGGVVLHMGYDDMRDKLADGSIDAFSLMAPGFAKSPYVMPVEQKMGVRLLQVEPDAAQKIQAQFPYVSYTNIQGGLYKLHPNPVPAIGITMIQVCRAALPDNLVYDMVASLMKHKTDYQKNLVNFPNYGNPDVVFSGFKEAGIPLHPGAAKWYRDNGVTIPSDLEVKP